MCLVRLERHRFISVTPLFNGRFDYKSFTQRQGVLSFSIQSYVKLDVSVGLLSRSLIVVHCIVVSCVCSHNYCIKKEELANQQKYLKSFVVFALAHLFV